MTHEIVRSKRLRKKMHVGEFAIQGFGFNYAINLESEEAYEAFFNNFVDLIGERNLFISLNSYSGRFEGIVTSGERYGNATEADRAAVIAALEASDIVSDMTVGELMDATDIV